MPYVSRNGGNAISGVFINAQAGYADEFLPSNDPAVVAFLNPPTPALSTRIDLATFQVLFNHENRIRALESKAALTVPQFKAALVTLLGG